MPIVAVKGEWTLKTERTLRSGDIAETLTLLHSLTEDFSKREKILAKHRRYNASAKGRYRYQKYNWKRNKLALEARIIEKKEKIASLERLLEICQRNLR